VHVTMRLCAGLPTLRGARTFRALRRVLAGAREAGTRVTHYSVMSNHLHMLVEANDRETWMRQMKGLSVRMARGINRVLDRAGQVFADRYHARILRSPREVRNGIAYVLLNAR